MINSITLNSRYCSKERMLNNLASSWDPTKNLNRIPVGYLEQAKKIPLYELDTTIRNGNSLSVLESFAGMLHVIAGTNCVMKDILFSEESQDTCRVKGAFYLTRMASKEQYVGLTPEEIAGMVMAGFLDVVYCPLESELTETSGMGADRGWRAKKVKTINASTLSALVAASMGYKTIKHGSYGNTTKVGSTDVPEQFGANICQENPQEVERLLRECNFWFNDAHAVKTLHYLSHLLMVETVNHIVGPMTPPVGQNTTLYKLMGVNHYVHPETVAKAYVILHDLGVVDLGGVAVIAGVRGRCKKGEKITDRDWYYNNCYLDEVSLGFTLVSFARDNNFLGTELLETSKVFNITFKDEDIQVENEINTLMRANQMALTGQSPYAEYLAINSAFALLPHFLDQNSDLLSLLPIIAHETYDAIKQGLVFEVLKKYVAISKGRFVSWE